jgi:hypothetical protein
VRKLVFFAGANAQFRALLSPDERAVVTERLLKMAEDPDIRGSLSVVGDGTTVRRAKILGVHFFLLPTETTESLPEPMLVVMKVRGSRRE